MNSWEWFLDWSLLSGILDVLLVYILIYRSLLLVRGTRAEPMLLGLAMIAMVYALSRKFHLATLNWILGNFLGSVILVIVVVFQDDLRRALTKVGLIPGLAGSAPQALDRSIKEIAKAAAELASRRIGALIVIQRDVGLSEYTEHAVQLDALVSHQLLTSIFLPVSPLHDGAVVVEGERAIAAGAVLPLSFNPSVSSAYGTRHRAAIGLSERTDALMVVVSEETGGISLIRDGRITKDLNEKTLYSALQRLAILRRRRAGKGGILSAAVESVAGAKVAKEAEAAAINNGEEAHIEDFTEVIDGANTDPALLTSGELAGERADD